MFPPLTSPPPIVRPDLRMSQALYLSVPQSEAWHRTVSVEVKGGRATTIDFLPIGETIQDVLLADPSRLTYTTDVGSLKESASSTVKPSAIYLRATEKITFPGLTTSPITNLIVTTVDGQGKKHRYNFEIMRSEQPRYLGVKIVSDFASEGEILDAGKPLSPWRVQQGVQAAISLGYTASDDPIVGKVQQWVDAVSQGEDPISSARSLGISIPVLRELARLGEEQEMKQKIPVSNQEPGQGTPIPTNSTSTRIRFE